jgi:hypothetical protein
MSMKSSARNSAKAKARRLCGVQTGKVDASGWKQPYASKTPSARRAYAAGGKVGCDGDKDDKYVGEVEKEAGVKKRADKRPRKMDGGPTVGTGDPREFANAMMQGAANRAPVSGSNPIPTYTTSGIKKSPLRGGFEKGGKVAPKFAFKGDKKDDPKPEVKPSIAKKVAAKTPAGTAYPQVPKRLPLSGNNAIMPDTDGGPALKKGGRACKAGGGPIAERNGSTYSNGKLDGRAMNKREIEEMADEDQANERDNDADDQFAARVEAGKALAGRKAGGRTERKAGGRVGKGKTNINIIIAPAGGGAEAAPAPQMGAPGMPKPPMPPAPPPAAPGGPGAPPAAGGGMPANPLAGMPPQAIAAMMGAAGGGGGASMPPSGPPRLPMRAAGGRLVREIAGAGSAKADSKSRTKPPSAVATDSEFLRETVTLRS